VLLLVCSLLLASPALAALAAVHSLAPPDAAAVPGDAMVPTAAGVDVYAPGTVQLAGATRIETAIAVSKFGWQQSDCVVIATAMQFPDALVGAPLASLLGAPILLTDAVHLASSVAAEVKRLGASSAVLLGGKSAIGDAVIADLVQLGISRGQIVRIGGTDRYDTSRLVAHRVCETTGLGERVAVAVGTNYPDALAASVLASRIGMPIVLTRGDQLSPAAAEVLRAFGTTETLVAGGVAAISNAVTARLPNPVRIGGANRFETATLLGEYATRFGLLPLGHLPQRWAARWCWLPGTHCRAPPESSSCVTVRRFRRFTMWGVCPPSALE
jgi:putative cell wall-binding protein